MKISLLETAVEDLLRARDFYDSQELGVGDHFMASLKLDLDSLKRHAGIHVVVNGYHKMFTKKFPYAIYYKMFDKECLVFHILDMRIKPSRTTDTLRGH